MKRIWSAALAMTMAASLLAVSASAAAPEPDISKMSVEQVANLDLDSASEKTQEAILAARREIIYGGQAWTVDGKGAVVNLKDGTVTPVAKFEDLFPGWDVPEYNPSSEKNLLSGVVQGARSSSDIASKTVYLRLAGGTDMGKCITRFNGSGKNVSAFANTSPRDAKCDLSVFQDGEALGWYPGLKAKTSAVFGTNSLCEYTVHAGAADQKSVGNYRMIVTETIGNYSKADFSKMSVEQVANLDLNSASEKTQEAILAARREIIFGGQAWTVGGAVSLRSADGTEQKLPEFSELFPGWDIPEVQLAPIDPAYVSSASKSSWPITKNVTLSTANQKIGSFFGDGKPVYIYPVTTPCDGAAFNFGITDDNGANLGWIPGVTENQRVKLETSNRIYYHVRTSVSKADYAGQCQMTITDVK